MCHQVFRENKFRHTISLAQRNLLRLTSVVYARVSLYAHLAQRSKRCSHIFVPSDKTSFSHINCRVCVRSELIEDRMEDDYQAIDSEIQDK